MIRCGLDLILSREQGWSMDREDHAAAAAAAAWNHNEGDCGLALIGAHLHWKQNI